MIVGGHANISAYTKRPHALCPLILQSKAGCLLILCKRACVQQCTCMCVGCNHGLQPPCLSTLHPTHKMVVHDLHVIYEIQAYALQQDPYLCM